MKVKIASKFYDTDKQPIMIILTQEDNDNISNMPVEATKYCVYPEGFNQEQIEQWMDIDE